MEEKQIEKIDARCFACRGEGKIYFGHLGRAGKWLKGRPKKCKECNGRGYKLIKKI